MTQTNDLAVVPTAPQGTSLAVLSVEGKISKNDIVDIGVAKLESKLIAAEKEATVAWKACKEASAQATKDYDKELKAFASGKLKANLKAVNDALKAIGLKGKSVTAAIHTVDLWKGPDDKRHVRVSLVIHDNYTSGDNLLFKPSAGVLAAHKNIKVTADAEQKAVSALQEIRTKMGQMARLERQLRACLAETQLGNTEEGSKIVDLIEASTDDFLATL